MAGRRLIEAAKLFNASKSVVQQHLKLRSQQLDVYGKTSTIAKAARSQTDRVTLTLNAAIALSRRLGEEPPPPAPAAAPRATNTREEHATWTDTDPNQTHAPSAELLVVQKEAQEQPLPDGSIPSADVTLEGGVGERDTCPTQMVAGPSKKSFMNEDAHTKDPGGSRPTVCGASTIPTPVQPSSTVATEAFSPHAGSDIPFHANKPYEPSPPPAVHKLQDGLDRDEFNARSVEIRPQPSWSPGTQIPAHTEDSQESNGRLRDGQSNQDVYSSVPEPAQEQVQREQTPGEVAVPEEDSIPEGVNTDVFQSPRVAKLLGGKTYRHSDYPTSRGVAKMLQDPAQTIVGHNQSAFNVQGNSQRRPFPSKSSAERKKASIMEGDMQKLGLGLAKDVEAAGLGPSEKPIEINPGREETAYALRESRVPSSRLGRFWQYAGLGTSMAFGAVSESFRRATGSSAASGGSLMLSPGNIELLVSKLSRMRGAALKLGQMISIQDIKMLPPAIHEVLQRVQDSADYMPASQRNKVLSNNLGSSWRELFDSFDDIPLAAASIGQVHKAVLKSTKQNVAVKVQYPGVANSIDSDLNNLSILLTASRLLPSGLFLDKTIANARTELGWECDYIREAQWQMRFHDALADDTDAFLVPRVIPEASGREVLTAELVDGVGVAKLPNLSQEKRDWIGTQILRLCLREIVEFKFMQTDPNWTNFLYNEKNHKIELLDFGASREYSDEFVEPYVNILIAASEGKRSTIRDLSVQLGYLTGAETSAMLQAHIDSVLTLAEPFRAAGPEVYDFRDQTITDRVRSLIPVMVRERLAPPPEETYSLHRKLSGAFLLCARLGSRVSCRSLFEKAIAVYQQGGRVK